MARKLASIRVISDLVPIDGADFIETAVIDGWKAVVKKGEFAVGEKVVYCEVDSWIPMQLAPFLSKGVRVNVYNGVKGERLKTIKLKGQISQGLVLKLDQTLNLSQTEIGTDVTAQLGIQKYEPVVAASLGGLVKGSFPSFLIKTDEERVQNLNLNKFFGSYYATEKLDGSSMTVFWRDGEFGVCSRNLQLAESDQNSFWQVAKAYELEEKLRKLNKKIAIQGEIIGPGIQKNKYALSKIDFRPFSLFDIDSFSYLTRNALEDLCYDLGLTPVPVVFDEFLIDEKTSIDALLAISEDKSLLNNNVEREGLVFRLIDNDNTSFKVISNKFLLAE